MTDSSIPLPLPVRRLVSAVLLAGLMAASSGCQMLPNMFSVVRDVPPPERNLFARWDTLADEMASELEAAVGEQSVVIMGPDPASTFSASLEAALRARLMERGFVVYPADHASNGADVLRLSVSGAAREATVYAGVTSVRFDGRSFDVAVTLELPAANFARTFTLRAAPGDAPHYLAPDTRRVRLASS